MYKQSYVLIKDQIHHLQIDKREQLHETSIWRATSTCLV